MAVDAVLGELELLLSDFGFSGLKNAQPILLQRLDGLQKQLEALGMLQGARRAQAFSEALGAFRRGECGAGRAVDALCALEFYCKHALNG